MVLWHDGDGDGSDGDGDGDGDGVVVMVMVTVVMVMVMVMVMVIINQGSEMNMPDQTAQYADENIVNHDDDDVFGYTTHL